MYKGFNYVDSSLSKEVSVRHIASAIFQASKDKERREQKHQREQKSCQQTSGGLPSGPNGSSIDCRY